MSQHGPTPPDEPQEPPAGQAPDGSPPSGAAPPPPGWGPTPAAPPPPGWGAPPPGAAPPAGGAPPPAWGAPPYAAPAYAGYGWGGPPPAPKPGTIPLRPLGVGDILEGTFSVLRRYPGATLGSAAVVVGIVSVAQLLLALPLLTSLDPLLDVTATTTPDDVVATVQDIPWVAFVAGSVVVGLLSFALFVMLAGVLSIVVGRSAIGEPLSFTGAWKRAMPRVGRLLVASVLVVLLVSAVWVVVALGWVVAAVVDAGLLYAAAALLTLAAIPVSVYLGVSFSLTTPAVALETAAGAPIGPLEGLRRSRVLTRGAWWRTFGILLLGAVIAGALSQIIAIPVGIVLSVAPLGSTLSLLASTLAAWLGQAVAAPISGLVLALVYVDRRIRAEGLAEALARAAGVDLDPRAGSAPEGPPWPATGAQ